MQIEITESSKGENGFYVQASCNKVTAFVAIHTWGVQVCCQNSAHKVWRGAGKFFKNAAEALDNYRSGEMKAIINAAVDFSQQSPAQITHRGWVNAEAA